MTTRIFINDKFLSTFKFFSAVQNRVILKAYPGGIPQLALVTNGLKGIFNIKITTGDIENTSDLEEEGNMILAEWDGMIFSKMWIENYYSSSTHDEIFNIEFIALEKTKKSK